MRNGQYLTTITNKVYMYMCFVIRAAYKSVHWTGLVKALGTTLQPLESGCLPI